MLDAGWCIVTFTRVGSLTWTVPAGVTHLDGFLVGGGGGGSGLWGGGGGAGGVVMFTGLAVGQSSYVIGVGGGGAGQGSGGGDNGQASWFHAYEAWGGGSGGAYGYMNNVSAAGRAGGSGGGTSETSYAWVYGGNGSQTSYSSDTKGAETVSTYGNRGGNQYINASQAGGGGGGAAGQGGDVSVYRQPGNGGNGVKITYSSQVFRVAAGGGGGSYQRSAGGAGGSVDGIRLGGEGVNAWPGDPNPVGQAGVANTGSGGGGARQKCNWRKLGWNHHIHNRQRSWSYHPWGIFNTTHF